MKHLRPYTVHGFPEIDNNPAECAMRPIGACFRKFRPRLCEMVGRDIMKSSAGITEIRMIDLGRENYPFMGSASGDKAAAIAYTLFEAARLNGIAP